jgi:putative ABC transport system permease protein
MFRNYFKVALRYLFRHKGYTTINALGLAVGIACCILLMLFVRSEWSFDRFHSKTDRIYRAWLEEHYQGELFRNTVTPIPLVPVLQAGLPEVEASCRIAALRPPIQYKNNTFNDPVNMVDSSFFRLFDFPLEESTEQNPFPTHNSLVITKSSSKKYFGADSPIGKTLELQLGNDKVLFTVTALAKDPPQESTIQFDMLIPFSNAPSIWSEGIRTSAWSNVSVSSFFLLKKGSSIEAVQAKVASIMNPLVAKSYKPGEYLVRLQPLKDIHFNSTLPETLPGASDPKYSYILGTIGLLVLLIACINFVTLSIGRSATRALEVGVRKVLGADRQQLIRQFWGEAILLTLFALVLGVALALVLLKPFNQLANRELVLSADAFTLIFCLLLVVLIGLVAGIYPAFILSGFKPIQVLKGRIQGGNMGLFRKALIVRQFTASIVMIICTITIGEQLEYLQGKNLGYDKEHIIIVPTNKRRLEGNLLAERFETAVRKNPQVVNTTTSLYSMAEAGWMQLGYNDNQNVFRRFRFNGVDADFISAMGLQVVAGRDFQKDNSADSNNILVNEALVREYRWTDPIGKKLPGKYSQEIIGVVKDFHFESLHNMIQPAVLALKPDSVFAASTDVTYDFSPQPRVSVRFRGGNLQEHIQFLRGAWKSVAGDQDFEYQFLDEALAASYQQEQRLGNMVQYASFLSIFIACMGLFGLATLIVVRRTKEIGIRKVLGADVTRIVTLLSREFLNLVLIASLIAFPVAWWALHQWLQDFAYRIAIPIWIFLAAAIMALVVVLGTVSIQTIKAALTNPVKSLRTE